MLPYLSWTLYTASFFTPCEFHRVAGDRWAGLAQKRRGADPKGADRHTIKFPVYGSVRNIIYFFVYLFISLGVYLAISLMYFQGALSKCFQIT